MLDIFTGCCCYILWNVHKNRSRTPAACNLKSFTDGTRKFCHIFDNVAVFCYRHNNPGYIHLLERILSKEGCPYVACNGYHRHRIHLRSCNTCHKIGSSWSGCSQAYTYLAGSTGITICCMGRSLLMGGKYVSDLMAVFVQGVIYIQDGSARITEHSVHTLFQKTFYNDLSTCKLHVCSSCCLIVFLLFCLWHFQNGSSVAGCYHCCISCKISGCNLWLSWLPFCFSCFQFLL